MKASPRIHWWDVATVAAGLGIALALRVSLIDFKSVDYFNYTKDWYATLKSDGFAAFGRGFSNYNLPYLYLLYAVVRFMPDLPPYVAVKIPSLVADFVAAFLAFRIVATQSKSVYAPLLSAFALLIAPTVVLNSAFWGQADAVYTCALLGCLWGLAQRRGNLAMALFGLAVALKAQSVFLLPVLAGLILRREIRWQSLAWVPVILLLSVVPAWAAGRSPLDLLMIYPDQAAQYQQLTLHAPTALSWIPDTGRYFAYFDAAGLFLAATAALGITWAVYRAPANLSTRLLFELALLSAILVPFCLPRMHERYFYLADVLSIVAAFLTPALFYAPVMMIIVSFLAYQPTLFATEPVSMGMLALGVFVLIVALVRDLALRLAHPDSALLEVAPEVELGS